ncbi:PQQ-dependent sugar dehydrogenase [Streptosporangium lutulentum]
MLLALAAILHPIPASAAPPVDPTKFQQVTLAKGVAEVGEPMSMAVLPDRSVLHTARDGTVRITDAAGNTKVSGKLSVYFNDEEGMQGVGVDPGFASNRFVYLYYAPPLSTPPNNAPLDGTAADFARFDGVNRLSRFRLNTDGTLDLASEKAVLDVKTSRGFCCHVGGDIDFDAAGNLYLTTGDDSEPGFNDGYAPLDDRATRNPALDAQRGAANTNDLRGKVLRIKVNADGSYSIPASNMFPPGTANTRPEIYAMGFRNPFRMSVDKATGWSTSATTVPTRAPPVPGDRAVRSSSTGSPGRASTAGRTARVTTPPPRPTPATTTPPGRSARSTTARAARRTPRATTPARSNCPRPSPPGSPTTAATCRSSAAAPSRRWAVSSTATTPR